jgi:hypothetical protein
MGALNPQVTFETDFFKPLPGEEEQTNPSCYGQALALWLRDQLLNRGVSVEEVLPEDFGWVVATPTDPPASGSSSLTPNVRCRSASSAVPIRRRRFRHSGARFKCWCPPFLVCGESSGSNALQHDGCANAPQDPGASDANGSPASLSCSSQSWRAIQAPAAPPPMAVRLQSHRHAGVDSRVRGLLDSRWGALDVVVCGRRPIPLRRNSQCGYALEQVVLGPGDGCAALVFGTQHLSWLRVFGVLQSGVGWLPDRPLWLDGVIGTVLIYVRQIVTQPTYERLLRHVCVERYLREPLLLSYHARYQCGAA